jgi:putative transposase
MPHHVTQRGNRRQQAFFNEGDYQVYLELMAEWCQKEGVEIWAYCLMPNHTHLIAVPQTELSLRRAIGEAHRRYTRGINFREKWRGYLWQGRFASFVMDEPYLLAAARYVELNPVRAGLVACAEDWLWSSARAHLSGRDDQLIKVAPLLAMVPDWRALLDSALSEEEIRDLREHGRTGRPLGNVSFVECLERMVGRILAPRQGGRPSKLRRLP